MTDRIERPELTLAELRAFMAKLNITRLLVMVEAPWTATGPAVAVRDGRFEATYARCGGRVLEGALLSLGEQWSPTVDMWRAR